MSTVILHQWEFSPFCTKIRKMLDYKGIPYSVVNYNGFRVLKAKQLSKTGKLPVLEIKGEKIQDSRNIANYLDEHYPDKPLMPKDLNMAAKAELLQDWADESIYFYELFFRVKYKAASEKVASLLCEGRPFYEKPLLGPAFKFQMGQIIKQQGVARSSKAAVEKRFLHLMAHTDHLLSENKWLAGESISVADFALFGQLNEVLRTSHLNEQILQNKNLASWVKQF